MSERRADEVIEFHRGGGRGIAGPLALGIGLMAFGALLVLGAIMFGHRSALAQSATFGGIIAILAAPAVVLGGLFRRAVGEACVTLRRDGLQFEQLGDTTFVKWSEIDDARAKDGKVEVVRAGGPALEIDAGIPDPEAFAARLLELRREAAFDVI